MGYVLPKGSSKNQTSYRTTDGSKKRRSRTPVGVKLPEPVRIPPPQAPEKLPQQ
jgi:hypothetical protein